MPDTPLHVLMISLDRAIAAPGESDARRRHLAYAEKAGRLTILAPAPRSSAPIAASPAVTIRPVSSQGGVLAFAWRAAAFAQQVIEQADPPVDLIVTQDVFFSGWAGVQAARGLIPLLVQNHSTIFDNPAWLAERPLLNRARLHLACWVLARADYYRTVNARERDHYIDRLGGDPNCVTVLPLGTASAAFAAGLTPDERSVRREAFGLTDDHRVVLWVGYPVPFKRAPLLLDVMRRVIAREPCARLLFVGDVSRSADDLPAIARALGIADQVAFAGAIAHHELPAIYALADAYAMTSSYEGVPRVLFEAAAAGLARVAFRVPGVEEAIADGVTGALIADGDADALAARLAALLDDPAEARRLGEAARAAALRDHNAADYADRWVAVWRRAAKKS